MYSQSQTLHTKLFLPLAKWKRHTLARFGFNEGEGLVVNMKALRPDEDSLDATPLFMLTNGTGKRLFPMDTVILLT